MKTFQFFLPYTFFFVCFVTVTLFTGCNVCVYHRNTAKGFSAGVFYSQRDLLSVSATAVSFWCSRVDLCALDSSGVLRLVSQSTDTFAC